MVSKKNTLRAFAASGAAAGVLMAAAACAPSQTETPVAPVINEASQPWPNAAVEREARIAAAGRSTCRIAGLLEAGALAGSQRDNLILQVVTFRDPQQQYKIDPYENKLGADGQPIPNLGQPIPETATDNPHRNRVQWGVYTADIRVAGLPVLQPPDNENRLNWIGDNTNYADAFEPSHTKDFAITPRNDYRKGTELTVVLHGEAQSRTETIGSDGQSHITTEQVASEIPCGAVIQSGDTDKGVAGWVVDDKTPAPFTYKEISQN